MSENISSWSEAIEIVRKNHTINFIAKAVTQWNALSIDALLFYLESKGYIINAAIIIAEHYSSGYLIDESFFTNKCAKYFLLSYKSQTEEKNNKCDNRKVEGIKQKLSDAIDFYKIIFTPRSFCINKKDVLFYSTFDYTIPDSIIIQKLGNMGRPIVTCRTEEGIGPYMGTFNKAYVVIPKIWNLKEIHGYFRAVFMGRIVYRFFHKTYNSLTFKHTLRGLKRNKSIIPFYHKVFSIRNTIVRPQIDKNLMANSVIICTASWKRHLIENDEDLIVLRMVCDNLHRRGFSLLLKAHPRDLFFPTKLVELHCTLLDVPGLSMESLCEFSKPKAVISFASTTLVNPSLFWNIPTYCVTDMLNRNNVKAYIDEIDSFKRIFKNFVHFVKSPDEIKV